MSTKLSFKDIQIGKQYRLTRSVLDKNKGDTVTVSDKGDDGAHYIYVNGYKNNSGYGICVDAFEELPVALDLTKPLETKGGRPFTLLSKEGRAPNVLVGYLDDSNQVRSYTADGKYYEDGRVHLTMDLRNVEPKPLAEEGYMNIYREGDKLEKGAVWPSRKIADENVPSYKTRVGCIKFKLVEGQWDE